MNQPTTLTAPYADALTAAGYEVRAWAEVTKRVTSHHLQVLDLDKPLVIDLIWTVKDGWIFTVLPGKDADLPVRYGEMEINPNTVVAFVARLIKEVSS